MPYRTVQPSEQPHDDMFVGGMFIGYPTEEEATMACPHAISVVRVHGWWDEAERKEALSLSVCPCCGGPMPYDAELCRFCNIEVRGQIELPAPWYVS